MGHEFISDVLQPLSVFGGIAMIIWASAKAKLEHRKLDMQRGQTTLSQPQVSQPQDTAVLAELKALKQQMAEMHSTSHGFDISFDEALGRLEGRVGRLETKSAASASTSAATSSASADAATLRNGQGQ